MIYKKLGNTETQISAIGLGTTGSGSYANIDTERTKKRIDLYRHAIDMGINYFDTAELYGGGYAEEVLGEAVKGMRDKVFIASKFNPGNSSFDDVLKSVEGSLRRLKVDYIDLYQIHWPNPLIPISETMRALEDLVDQGKIKYIGVSNFSLNELREAQSSLKNEPLVSMQVEYNLLDRTIEHEILPDCAKNNVTVIAYSPLNKGKLSWSEEQKKLLHSLAIKYESSSSQVILSWLVSHSPVIALTRTSSLKHLRENNLSTEFVLEGTDLELMGKVFCEQHITVATEKIRVNGIDDRAVYISVHEAIENKLDLIPSPSILAENALLRKEFKPVRLVPTKDRMGKYDYDLDSYDLMGEAKKYWAWIIAYGNDVPIPAYCIDDNKECN
jgi:aryl-alcohol dehydrogenase-like predicted oxidoreductase